MDPLAQYSNGISLFEYVDCCPVVFADPFGLKPETPDIYEYENPGITGHAGLIVNGEDIDFGPKDTAKDSYCDAYFGRCPYPSGGPGPGAKKKKLSVKKYGEMEVGPKKNEKCKNLTLRNAAICIKYLRLDWDNSVYMAPFRNCNDFVRDAKKKCCLTAYPNLPFDESDPPIIIL